MHRGSVVHSLKYFPEHQQPGYFFQQNDLGMGRSSLAHGFREGTVITGDEGLIICLTIKHVDGIEPLAPLLRNTLYKYIQGTQSLIPGYRSTFLCVNMQSGGRKRAQDIITQYARTKAAGQGELTTQSAQCQGGEIHSLVTN